MDYKVRAILGVCVVLASLSASGFDIYSDGGGTISPDLDGKDLVEGRIYTITARPVAGYLFYVWHLNGDTLTSPVLQIMQLNRKLYVKEGDEFIPSSEGVLIAEFHENYFFPAAYIGLSYSGKPAEMKLQVSRQGSFSAKLNFEGKSYPLSGKFSPDGTINTTFQLSSNLVAAVRMDWLPGDVSVFFDWGGARGPFDDFVCKLVSFHSGANVRKQLATKYTMAIMNDYDDSLPKGDGFATLTVDRSGAVRMVGKFADGVPFTQGASITDADSLEWPFFISLNKGAETASGWIQMYASDWTEVSGSIQWEKLPQTNASTYQNGFLGNFTVEGSTYNPPSRTNQILEVTNLIVSYGGGTLPNPFVNPSILTSDNRIVATNGNQQIFKIQPQTGLFTGTAIFPEQGQGISCQGVLIQHFDFWQGSGYFLQAQQSGRIRVEPQPPPLSVHISTTATNIVGGMSQDFTAEIGGYPTDYFWDFGDGTIVHNSIVVSHTWTTAGDFQVTLLAFDDAHPGGLYDFRWVHVTPPTLSVKISEDSRNLIPYLAKDFGAVIHGTCTAYFWNFDDGTIVSNAPLVAHSWPQPGDYNVILRAFSPFFSGGISATSVVHVVPESTHYVSISSTNPVTPYLSWETAATNIQDAINVAMTADVVVSNGVYETGGTVITNAIPYPLDERLIPCRVAVTRPITVSSANGPDVTVIEGRLSSYAGSAPPCGSNAVRGVYLTNGAALIGFTVTNSATELGGAGGGIFCASASATVSNCILVLNSANDGGGIYSGTAINCRILSNGGGHGGAAFNSILLKCTLWQNYAGDSGGACFRCALTDCKLDNNSALLFGGGVYGSTLDRCVLSANSAEECGGAFDSTLNNCLLIKNSAQSEGAGYGVLNNCTVVSNSAMYVGGMSGTMNNSILAYNEAPQDANYLADSTLNFCCTSPMATNGLGNITSDPGFVDLAGGDFHLLPTSPCVNAGSNSYVTNSFDLDGNPRIFGGTVDMGAFELQSAPVNLPTQYR